MQSLKHSLVAGSPAHWMQVLALLAYAFIEFVLPRTKRLKANSVVELVANMLHPILGKVPLVGQFVALLKTPEAKAVGLSLPRIGALLPLLLLPGLLSGCATVQTKPGETLTQRLADDEQLVKSIALHVETQCGPQFAGLGPIISGIVAIASTPADVLGDIAEAAKAIPVLVQDARGTMCVYRVVSADLKAAKPKKAAFIDRAISELVSDVAGINYGRIAVLELPPVCETRPDPDHGACRPVTIDCGTMSEEGCVPDGAEVR